MDIKNIQSEIFHFASNKLTLEGGKLASDSLNLEDYSRFKHGFNTEAEEFAKKMVEDLYEEYPSFFRMKYGKFAIASFPHKELRSAACTLVDYMVEIINYNQALRGLDGIVRIDLHKQTGNPAREHNYPELNQAERELILAEIEISGDLEKLNRIQSLLLVDDIYVTGSSAQCLLNWFKANGYTGEKFFSYIAKVNEDISPEIEAMVNHHKIKTLRDVSISISEGREFNWNIRVLKFALSSECPEDFGKFISTLSDKLLFSMIAYSSGMNYQEEKKGSYRKNLQAILEEAKRRKA